jgi:hypothetical protein
MEEAQTTKRKRLMALVMAPKRQNLSEKEIPPSYSTEKKGN